MASLMLIAALLFAVVALAGNKAEYPALMAICAYAAVVDLLAAGHIDLAAAAHYDGALVILLN